MNFTELYQKIRTLDEAGLPPPMDPNAMMQQQMGAMQAKMPNLDPATMMKNQQARMAQMQQKNKAAGTGEYKVNGKVVDKATYDAFMAQHPELRQLTPGQMPAMPGQAPVKAGQQPAADDTDWEESIDNTPEKPVEECGPMGPSGMMGMRDQQQDSVNMNLSMNGQGVGGIRDLMSILKNIETGGSDSGMQPPDGLELDIKSINHPHDEPNHDEVDHEIDGIVFGNDMEEEYANEPNEMYSTIDDVTNMGSNDGRGDNEQPKVNGGGNPYTMAAEGLKRQLQNLYQEVKTR